MYYICIYRETGCVRHAYTSYVYMYTDCTTSKDNRLNILIHYIYCSTLISTIIQHVQSILLYTLIVVTMVIIIVVVIIIIIIYIIMIFYIYNILLY